MDPTTLSIPETLRLLSALSYDISSSSRLAGIPKAEKRFNGDRLVRKLLDALAFFLHTRPNRGDHFAMTLTIVHGEIVATVAANTPDDIPHTGPSSPQVILHTVWKHMLAYSGTTPKRTENTEFTTYVLETHLPLLRSRLSKWRVCYESFRQRCSRYRQRDSLSVALVNYLDDADKIFCATLAFSESAEPLSNQTIGEFMTHIRLSNNLSRQLAKLSDNDREILSGLQRLSGKATITKRYLDVIRFGEKLASPIIHINRVLQFCTDPKYQDFLTKTFGIRILPNAPIRSIDMPTRLESWTKAEVAVFLHRSYKTIGWSGRSRETIADTIDHLSGIVMDNIGSSRISGPHCECLLMQHHHKEAQGELIMETYIAMSKPCCLQCGIFLDAYNQVVTNGPLFFIRGRDLHIRPSVVPSIDVALDASIVEKMTKRLDLLIGYTLHAYMGNKY
ncbi:hypothetical protein QCA50_014683 [Cerrena zonata]|uniref:Uncharacterized protein n=1 Tax=Cerrena zonata TaxID=2478898 RepID=A0AAW0FS33_9APHY